MVNYTKNSSRTIEKYIQVCVTCMPVFNTHRELRISNRYDTLKNGRMTENSMSEKCDSLNAHRDNVDSQSKARILTKEEVHEYIETYITSLTKQLEDLTRLIQGMSSVDQAKLSPRASTSANSSAAGTSSDKTPQMSVLSLLILDSIAAFALFWLVFML